MRVEHGSCYVAPQLFPPFMLFAILLVAGCALLGLGLVGTVMLLWASWHAPEGYEDEQGFCLVDSLPSRSSSSPVTSPATTTGVTPGGEVISRLATTAR